MAKAFAGGHFPSEAEISGSWVLVGSWLHGDSHPDLNCTGIKRGKILEWVMFAHGYSLNVDLAGTLLKSKFEPRSSHLGFTMDLGGEANPLFRCRLTHLDTLVCMASPYYAGSEFKKIPVRCEPSESEAASRQQPMLCFHG